MFGVEAHSFLPNEQSDGRDLARQGKACHRWFHSSGNAGLVEILQRPLCDSGSRRSALEDVFQIVVMVDVEAADGQDLFGAFELTTDEAIFPAGVGFQCEASKGRAFILEGRREVGVSS